VIIHTYIHLINSQCSVKANYCLILPWWSQDRWIILPSLLQICASPWLRPNHFIIIRFCISIISRTYRCRETSLLWQKTLADKSDYTVLYTSLISHSEQLAVCAIDLSQYRSRLVKASRSAADNFCDNSTTSTVERRRGWESVWTSSAATSLPWSSRPATSHLCHRLSMHKQ